MKASVIIPCYNCEKTVLDTFHSLEQQTYQNFEVILINDGSTDRTEELLQEIACKSPVPVKCLYQENAGVSRARNCAMEHADGEYIFFVDSDDCVHEQFLEKMICALETNNTDTAYCFLTRKQSDLSFFPEIKTRFPEGVLVQQQFMQTVLYEKYRLGFVSFAFRKTLLEQNGIKFTEGLKTGEDLEFLWKYLSCCQTAYQINRPMYWYYNNAQSAVHRVEWSRTESYELIQRISVFMQQRHCSFDETFSRYMSARFLWSYAKTFSVGKRADLFARLGKEYPVREGMAFLLNNCPDYRVRLTAAVYLIWPKLYYMLVSAIKGG